MAKKIFVLNGHPREASLSATFAQTYADAAQAEGHEVRVMNVSEMEFDPDFGQASFKNPKPLEPDLERALQSIEWAEHVVLTTPMWWGGLPAKLKGLIDRSFLPGRTIDTKSGKYPKPMLTGRTARVIMTSDTPGWYFKLIYKSALQSQLKRQTLGYIGLNPTRFTHFSQSSHPKPGVVARWIEAVRGLGAQAA
jgi:putative NADPH-quinone reductase